MKTIRSILKPSAILLIIILAVSCTKETPAPIYKNFVSKELSLQFTKEYLQSLVDIVSGTNPEVSQIKPLILNDIEIYKLVYKTNVNGEDTKLPDWYVYRL